MKREKPVAVGCVVKSLMGRDKGRFFIVLALPDDQHALIADGDLRKVEKPKKKKHRHLWVASDPIKGPAEQWTESGATDNFSKIENYQLRAALNAFKPNEEE